MTRRFLLPISVLLGVWACGETSTRPEVVDTRPLLQTGASPSASTAVTSPLDVTGVVSDVAVSDAEVLKVVTALIQEVGTLGKSLALNEGEVGALRNHLGTAADHIRDRRYDLAFPPLRVFHGQVSRFAEKGTLTPAQAESLLGGVAWVVTELLKRFACPAPTDIEDRLRESLEDQEAHPSIRMNVGIAEDATVVDRPVTLLAALREAGQPIAGVDVRASIRGPAGAYCVTLRLLDDGSGADETPGDGIYTAVFTPRQPGAYRLFVTADGAAGGDMPFVRARIFSLFVRAAPVGEGSPPSSGDAEGLPMLLENPVPPVLFDPLLLPGPEL